MAQKYANWGPDGQTLARVLIRMETLKWSREDLLRLDPTDYGGADYPIYLEFLCDLFETETGTIWNGHSFPPHLVEEANALLNPGPDDESTASTLASNMMESMFGSRRNDGPPSL
jgi:hypothetical protein